MAAPLDWLINLEPFKDKLVHSRLQLHSFYLPPQVYKRCGPIMQKVTGPTDLAASTECSGASAGIQQCQG